jgi:hypothetical protein
VQWPKVYGVLNCFGVLDDMLLDAPDTAHAKMLGEEVPTNIG